MRTKHEIILLLHNYNLNNKRYEYVPTPAVQEWTGFVNYDPPRFILNEVEHNFRQHLLPLEDGLESGLLGCYMSFEGT